MDQLALRARLYLAASYLAGLLALVWCFGLYQGPAATMRDWLLGAGLAAVAAVCQVFVVQKVGTNRSDHLTPAPFFAAVLLLPRPILALVIILLFLPEWYIYRRLWYIQLWNMASYLCVAVLTRFTLDQVTGHEVLQGALTVDALGVLACIPVFLGTQTVLLATVLRLARGQPLRESGLFSPEQFLLETGLTCIGLVFALAWRIDPLFGLAAALPLALVFQALHVPNLREVASTDSKTGLANMRHFNSVIKRDLERAERSNQPLSILMCDLDYLRNINNSFGHQAGDTVLVGIADIIRRHVRGSDIAARFGGEEFIVLLADTDAPGAAQVAERLRSELEHHEFDSSRIGSPMRATVSIGIASFPQHGRTYDTLLREADLAVYQAKREGRNRVVIAGRTSRELAGEWAREHLVAVPVSPVGGSDARSMPRWQFVAELTRQPIVDESDGSHPSSNSAANSTVVRPSRDLRQRIPIRVLAFVTTVFIAGLAGLLLTPALHMVGVWPLFLFGGMTVLAQQLAVDTSGRGKTSVAVVAVLGAAFLYGAPGILVSAAALAIVSGIKARSPLHRILFNFGTVLLSAEGSAWFLRTLTGGLHSTSSFGLVLLPAAGAGLTYYAINHLLVSSVRGLAERRRAWEIWQLEYRWLAPHYAVMGALGLVVALGYIHFGAAGVLALMAPVGMMHLAIKQYMDRTRVYVDELRRMNSRLSDSYEATLHALTRALDTRDEETEEHSQRVRRYTHLIAQRLKVPHAELEDILRGALLHDMGKIGVPDAVLLKPGSLTDSERTLMRKHPEIGYSMIAHIPFLARAGQVVLHHHEAYDGSGYPSGLVGTNVPLGARIFAVADTYDAMTSDRPYRKAMGTPAALAELKRCRGTQFDPAVVDAFLAIPLADLQLVQAGSSLPVEQQLELIVNSGLALAR